MGERTIRMVVTPMLTATNSPQPLRSILVTNRSEISIRVMRAGSPEADEPGTRQNRNLQGTRARTRQRP